MNDRRKIVPLRIRRLPAYHVTFPLIFLVALALLCGCAGYQVGNDTLYPPDIHTVYVPIFESDSFRRDLGEQLTEAVQKEIERRTPFKVVGTPNADSVLNGRITSDTKGTLVQEPNGEARDIQTGLHVVVAWADRKGTVVREGKVGLAPNEVDLFATSNLVPEFGASTATAQRQVIQRMARQIVDLMETPW